MELLFEVLLDWVDKSRPIFYRCTPDQTKISDVAACFMSPCYPISRLRAAVALRGETENVFKIIDPFETDVSVYSSGTRIVFLFADQLSTYAQAFLQADKTPDFSQWHFHCSETLSLPRIYDPTIHDIVPGIPGKLEQIIHVVKDEQHDFLVVLWGDTLWALEPRNWGKREAFIRLPPADSDPVRNVSWIGLSVEPGCFYIIREGKLFRLKWGEWHLVATDVPVQLNGHVDSFSSYYELSAINQLFILNDGSIWWRGSDGSVEQIFFSGDNGAIEPGSIVWLPHGGVVFSDKEGRGLYYADLIEYPGRNVKRIFGQVQHPSLSFCVDVRGILYVTENDHKRLHVFLPSSHWGCHVCGSHGTRLPKNRQCSRCNATLPEPSCEPYRAWFDIDLNHLGAKVGPLTVDSALNLYTVVDEKKIVALPLEKNDFWGKDR